MEQWYKEGEVFNSFTSIRKKMRDTSLPVILTDSIVAEFGFIKIVDILPISLPTQYTKEIGVELLDGIPTKMYTIVDKSVEQLEIEAMSLIPTISELKALGEEYNGYQVPLDEEAQIAVTSVAVMYLAGLFTGTVFHFSNGVKMPCSLAEFMPFATWFSGKRNAFFI